MAKQGPRKKLPKELAVINADKLLDEAAPLTDRAQRYALYNRAEKLVVADAPWVFLYNPVAYMIRQSWVNGYVLNPMRPTRLERVWLSPHDSGRN